MITNYDKEKINKNIEELFSKQIEINFLKRILWKTLEKYPIFFNYYHYDDPNEIEILPTGNIYNVICKHIIGIHTENVIFLFLIYNTSTKMKVFTYILNNSIIWF